MMCLGGFMMLAAALSFVLLPETFGRELPGTLEDVHALQYKPKEKSNKPPAAAAAAAPARAASVAQEKELKAKSES